jgi:hypothetical protein
MSENGSFARYFVEVLIGGMQEGTWIDLSTMEIRRGGNISKAGAEKPAIDASRGTRVLKRTPATRAGRNVSSLKVPFTPLIGLLRRLIVGSWSAQGGAKTPGAKKTLQPRQCRLEQADAFWAKFDQHHQ